MRDRLKKRIALPLSKWILQPGLVDSMLVDFL